MTVSYHTGFKWGRDLLLFQIIPDDGREKAVCSDLILKQNKDQSEVDWFHCKNPPEWYGIYKWATRGSQSFKNCSGKKTWKNLQSRQQNPVFLCHPSLTGPEGETRLHWMHQDALSEVCGEYCHTSLVCPCYKTGAKTWEIQQKHLNEHVSGSTNKSFKIGWRDELSFKYLRIKGFKVKNSPSQRAFHTELSPDTTSPQCYRMPASSAPLELSTGFKKNKDNFMQNICLPLVHTGEYKVWFEYNITSTIQKHTVITVNPKVSFKGQNCLLANMSYLRGSTKRWGGIWQGNAFLAQSKVRQDNMSLQREAHKRFLETTCSSLSPCTERLLLLPGMLAAVWLSQSWSQFPFTF